MAAVTPKKREREVCETSPVKTKAAKGSSVADMVAKIRADYAEGFQRLAGEQLSAGFKGTPTGQVPEEILDCFWCARRKHDCNWQYRDAKGGRRTVGSTCHKCCKSCCLLKVSRSTRALEAAGLKPAVRELSFFLQCTSKDKDVCRCTRCQDGHHESRGHKAEAMLEQCYLIPMRERVPDHNKRLLLWMDSGGGALLHLSVRVAVLCERYCCDVFLIPSYATKAFAPWTKHLMQK